MKTGKIRELPCRISRLLTIAFILGAPIFPLCAQRTGAAYERTILDIQQLIESGDLAGAKNRLTLASKQYPADGGLENLLGVVAIQQGRADDATRLFELATRHNPKLISAYLNLGRIYMQGTPNNPPLPAKALATYEKTLIVAPSNAEANYQAAVLLMLAHHYQRSLDHLAKLDGPTRGKVNALAIECADQAGLGHAAEAKQTAAAVVAHPDLTEADAMQIFPVLQFAHRPDLAALTLAAAGERNPLSPGALRALGLVQESSGNLNDARSTLERAFAANKTSTAILVDLARVARASRDYQGALGYVAHAREMEPSNASLFYYFGLISLDLSLLGESRKALAQAVQLAPDNPGYNFAMGIVSSFAQDPTLALPYLQRYHELKPADPAGILALGTTYFRAKDFETAETWLRRALGDGKTAGTAHYYLGRIARQQGRFDDAVTELTQADAAKPDQPDVLSELGEVYIQSHKYADAEGRFRSALALSPDNYAANFGLLQLYARTGDNRRDEQSKRFDIIQSKSQAQYQEMMRIIEIRPQE